MTTPIPLRIYRLLEGHDFQVPKGCQKRPSFLAELPAEAESGEAGLLRWSFVSSAAEADFALFPYLLDDVYDSYGLYGVSRFVGTIRGFREMARKTLFFFCNDLPYEFDFPSVFIRQSPDRRVNGVNTIAFPYLRPDLGCAHFDHGRFVFDTAFVGYVGSSPLRSAVLRSFYERRHTLRFCIRARKDFHGHKVKPEEASRRKQEFLDSLRDSPTILCPRGAGLNSFRFFETLSVGRIPILISDGCMLPFEARVAYDDAIFRMSDSAADRVPEVLQEWLNGLSERELMDRCRRCRALWDSCFAPRALAQRLIGELMDYRANHHNQLRQPFEEMERVEDPEHLLRKSSALCDKFVAQGDAVNSLCMLSNIKSILSSQHKPTTEVDVVLDRVRRAIGEQSEKACRILHQYEEQTPSQAAPPSPLRGERAGEGCPSKVLPKKSDSAG